MPSRYKLPTELDIGLDEDFTKDRLDEAFNYIVQKFVILDSFKPSFDEQLNVLRTVGLERLNEAFEPVYQRIVQIANLGTIFSASSTSTVEVGLGLKTFILSEADRLRFAPAAYLAVGTGDTFIPLMKGALSSYDRDTGALTLNVDGLLGEGTYTNWFISPTTPTNFAKAYTDDQIEALRAELINGATDAMNSFGEIEARIARLVGTATVAADTLGELEATAAANRQRSADDAVAMAIALG